VWQYLAPVEASGVEEKRASEGRLWCGMLRGWGCPFIMAGRGASAAGKGGCMAGVMAVTVNGN
jgi:hypothetical protein